jgi:hypothetical protein
LIDAGADRAPTRDSSLSPLSLFTMIPGHVAAFSS